MRWEQRVKYASLSDIGFRRKNNQDSLSVQICSDQGTWSQYGHLFLVADGMGGHAVGELASKIAADTLPHTYYKSRGKDMGVALKHAIERANSTIFERGAHNHEFTRMGTTCTALVLGPEGAVIGHVGDSRVYRVRGSRIEQLSFDHSLHWELTKQGRLDPDDEIVRKSRHVITRSLGPEETVEVDVEGPHSVLPSDVYVLCSDGLVGHVKDAEIGAIARELPPAEACRLLVSLANLRGGSDNITVLIVHVGELPEGITPAEKSAPVEPDGGLNWWWLAGMWAVAITLVSGISMRLLGAGVLAGALITAVSVIAAGALVLKWLNTRQSEKTGESISGDPDETVYWKPYRSSPAKLDSDFLSHLVAVEAELRRTASQEGWTIDWKRHDTAYNSAREALSAGRYNEALGKLASTIDVLMCGVQDYRRQLQRDRKWGKTPLPVNRQEK